MLREFAGRWTQGHIQGEPPAPLFPEKPMVAQMVVKVRGEDIEHHAAEQLVPVILGLEPSVLKISPISR